MHRTGVSSLSVALRTIAVSSTTNAIESPLRGGQLPLTSTGVSPLCGHVCLQEFSSLRATLTENGLPDKAELLSALSLVHKFVPPTPQFQYPLINSRASVGVWVKHENHTPLGAFKVRGGLVYLDTLKQEHLKASGSSGKKGEVPGVVAATRGNHGQSIAFSGRMHGLRTVVVVPHGNSEEKNAAMRALGAELVEHGHDFQASLEYSAVLAAQERLHAVPSFHRELVRGVATYAYEFFSAAPNLHTVYVPIGLGSGICGVIAAREVLGLKTIIVGVVSKHAPTNAISFQTGVMTPVEASTRIADGVACRVPNEDAFRTLQRYVDRIVQVSDDEVEEAMRLYFKATHNTAEGAGATSLAALLQERHRFVPTQEVGVVLTGGNIDTQIYAKILAKQL